MLLEAVRRTFGRKEYEHSNGSSDKQVIDIWIIWTSATHQHTDCIQENS